MKSEATPGREELRGQIAQALCCQGDLGKVGGCRYLRPERTALRALVDAVWQHATESEAVPSTDTADKLIDSALPSGTGVTEPDIKCSYCNGTGKVELTIGERNALSDIEMRDALQKSATPPVRGDRELLEQCAKLARQFELDMSGSQLDDRDIENIQHGANVASNAIADAILSLPVQCGAGEIETAFLNLCNALGLQATPLVYLDANAAHLALLSRQPPHSSREGGR